MNVVYAIPSYKRSDSIMGKTLATLKRGGVALCDIYIFVIDNEQEIYKKACPEYQVITGFLGLVEQREFIQSFFPLDTYIVMLDDDIEQLYRPIDCKTKEQILDIPSLIHQMIGSMVSEGVSICGIYPCTNFKFALGNKEITTDFRYLVGAMYVIKNLRDPSVQLNPLQDTGSHEDKIRTIKYYLKENKTLRYNWIQIKTKYFGKGGLDSPDRLKLHALNAETLCLRYPQFLRLSKKKLQDAKFKKVK